MGIILEALNQLKDDSLILKEDLEHWFKKNYKDIFGDIPDREINKRIIKLAQLDPTLPEHINDEEILKMNQPPYMQWLCRLLKKKYTTYEEMLQSAHEYKDQLMAFNDLKKRNRLPADKKDIMQYKSLEDVMTMLQSLGGSDDSEAEDSTSAAPSDFKQDVADIRAAITRFCRLEDRYIPQDIQKTSDVMNFLGGNAKWEIWEAKNEFATMLFDKWGKGAGWCVGGMLCNNYGTEQLRQAKNHFPTYNAGGEAHYVCFQQKDKNASRPKNKFLITLGPNGTRPNNGGAGYQFNDANNTTMFEGERYYDEDFQDAQMDALATFLKDEGLVDIFKKSKYGDCACFLNIENKQRLENGEPYRYVGGKIRPFFKDSIKEIIFKDPEGKEHHVNAEDHEEYLECESIIEMLNMENLINGNPYIYDGSTKYVPEKFRPLVREVILPEDYNQQVRWQTETYVGIPYNAFKGCSNMTKCTFPVSVVVLAHGCFRVNGTNAPYTDIEILTPRHRIKCVDGDDKEFLLTHMKYIGEGDVSSTANNSNVKKTDKTEEPTNNDEGE